MQLFAKDLMTRQFDIIRVDAPIEEAIEKIFAARIRPTGHKTVSLMVTDENNAVAGSISMYYILYHLRPSYLNYGIDGSGLSWQNDLDEFISELKAKTVRQIMNPNVLSVPPNEPLMAIVDQMIKNRVRRLCVVDQTKLIGMVYMSDIFYRLFAD